MSARVALIACLSLAPAACGGDPPAGDGGEAATGAGTGTSSTGAPPTTGAATTTGSDTTDTPTATSDTSGETTTSDESSDTTASESSDTGEAGFIYPDPEWQPGAPEDHGLSSTGLAAMASAAEQMDSNCLVVVQGGVLVGEWYWNGFDADKDQDNVYSITKSITSALVGIAAQLGQLDIEAPAGFSEWVGTDSEAVTIRNLISNDSGRAWDFNGDYIGLTFAPDQTQYAIDREHDEPIGTWWEYNNAAIQTLERALATAIAGDVGVYAQDQLFSKLGMTASMGHDNAGNPLTYQGVSASCRDLARLGYLYLRKGQWAGGVQVVPGAWVTASLEPSTPHNSAYGFMWWLNHPGHWILPSVPLRTEGDGKLIPGAPDEVFAAVGAFGQLVVVDPTTDAVWVRLGPTDLGDSSGFGKLDELWDAFAAAQLP
jgi:CubicO group peptidase (beta-lactamase class C family)